MAVNQRLKSNTFVSKTVGVAGKIPGFFALDKENNWDVYPWFFFGKKYRVSYKQIVYIVILMCFTNIPVITGVLAYSVDPRYEDIAVAILGKYILVYAPIIWLFEVLKNHLMLKIFKAPLSPEN